ncbi:MAG: hypothetical protein GEU79_11115 [Acidimicrobiia bacterium]|nr:hypothetical protein [Acidimicrobiia bacterium]
MTRRVLLLGGILALLTIPTLVWASHQFTDVPDEHLFHDDISWLADAGVTFGCNPPDNDRFCPDDGVTRGEMAAFMRRLSEGRVVDARSVLGRGPGALAGGSAGTDILTTGGPGGETLTLASHRVRSPAAGALKTTGHISVDNTGPGILWLELDSGGCGSAPDVPAAAVTFWAPPTPPDGDNVATSWVSPVGRGAHTVYLCAFGDQTQDSLVISGGGLSATWVPGSGTLDTSVETVPIAELKAQLDELGGGVR